MAHLSSRLWSLYVSECQDICVIIQITFQTHFKFSETLHHLNPKSLRSDGCMGINIDLVMFRRGREKWRGRNYSAICKPTITKIFPCGVLSCVDMYFLVWLLECHFPYSSKTLTVLLGLSRIYKRGNISVGIFRNKELQNRPFLDSFLTLEIFVNLATF